VTPAKQALETLAGPCSPSERRVAVALVAAELERAERLEAALRDLVQRADNLIDAVPPEWDGGDLGYLIGDLDASVGDARSALSTQEPVAAERETE
jgi:hypothetical protein